MPEISPEEAVRNLIRRYDADSKALIAVLCPLLIPIFSLQKDIFIADGAKHVRATFQVKITDENRSVLTRGRTGKFVPAGYGDGQPGWREIAKGRIISVDNEKGIAEGELYIEPKGDGGN